MEHLLNVHPLLGSRARKKGVFMGSSSPSLLYSNNLQFDLEDMHASRELDQYECSVLEGF